MAKIDKSFRIKDRPTSLDWVIIAVIGLLVQLFWMNLIQQPTYMDAFYYTTNGKRLVEGHGFTELIIWQFLDNPSGLPTPSHTYWMPLASILASAGYAIKNDFSGAQLPFWLLGGLLPLLAYAISKQQTGRRLQGWVAALFTAAGGYYAAFLNQPTTFAPFAWAGGFCLLALGMTGNVSLASGDLDELPAGRNKGKRRLWWFLAGLAAGAGHLTRADGLLLFLVGLLIWGRELLILISERKRQSMGWFESKRLRRNLIICLLLFLAGYIIIMGGWYTHNWLILGRALPSAGAQSMFLTTYDDLFAYGRSFSLNTFIDWGWANILRSKLQGLWFSVQTMLVIPGLIFLVPFILFAVLNLYREPSGRRLLRPFVLYTVVIFFSASLIFTFPGIRGMLFHSSVALWPWTTALAATGIGLAVDWVAARLSHWQPERAKRNFSVMFVVVALVLSLVVSKDRMKPVANSENFARVARLLPASSTVMVGNAPALHYYTGLNAISVPNEPVDVMLDAAERYGVSHVLLDKNRPAPLDDFYLGKEQHPRLQLLLQIEDMKLYKIVRPSE